MYTAPLLYADCQSKAFYKFLTKSIVFHYFFKYHLLH